MAYNPYSAVNAIYKLKGQWDSANTAGDETKKNEAAQKAKEYYKQLRNNGYSSVADELTAADYNSAKFINDYYAKTGRTATRPYLYSLGKQYGLSQNEMDNIIGWDNDTGEMSIGGKKVGRPDAVVDGTSYWGDTTSLDNAFNDYISRSGTTRSKATAVNRENENLFKKYNQEYEDLKSTNPFETDEAKSILAKYDLAGLQGRDNAVASNAGSNGGNIDSFAAANALRQQSSLINQGQQAVLEAYQQKLDHAKSLLSDMGVNIDRVYNQDETSKNNDVARKSEVASVTGYTPTEWSIQNDSFLKNFVDDNGKLKAEYYNTDFQELINNAKANGDTELANKYAILRGLKIFGNFSEYGKYLNSGDVAYVQPQQTESAREFNEQIAASDRALNAEQSSADADRQLQLDLADKSAQSSLDQINAQSNANIAQINAQSKANQSTASSSSSSTSSSSKSSSSSSKSSSSSSKTSSSSKAPLTESQVKAWAKYLNDDIASRYGSDKQAVKEVNKNQYQRADADADYIIIKVFSSDDLTQEQKEYLLYDKFGITEDQVNTARKDRHYK